MKDNMEKYKYTILNYWTDFNDLYINYVVINQDSNDKANVIINCDISSINCDLEYSTYEKVNEELLKIIKQQRVVEFDLPKISEVSPLLEYIYDFVCDSESNMCHIDYEDWENMKIENNFKNQDINNLKNEIEKYNLSSYITINEDGYKICGYGGLQCCFNDDREKGNIDLER